MEKEVLVIHPDDRSTDFLSIIYDKIPNKKVIKSGYSYDDIVKLLPQYERVIMLGHGSPDGLFSVGKLLTYDGYIINHDIAKLLENKPECVFIWCNADRYVNRHLELRGFYSGMFISEVAEARYMGLYGIDQQLVDESNNGFCEILSKYINEPVSVIYGKVVEEYGVIANENPVALYNQKRLYLK